MSRLKAIKKSQVTSFSRDKNTVGKLSHVKPTGLTCRIPENMIIQENHAWLGILLFYHAPTMVVKRWKIASVAPDI